mmetsp:Transcript_27872/g.61118  ORF Transcript_27872/g.61118 Transcript_27872/m.61118 type:complete len:213 (-) Transcript_27872:523-1161(-)
MVNLFALLDFFSSDAGLDSELGGTGWRGRDRNATARNIGKANGEGQLAIATIAILAVGSSCRRSSARLGDRLDGLDDGGRLAIAIIAMLAVGSSKKRSSARLVDLDGLDNGGHLATAVRAVDSSCRRARRTETWDVGNVDAVLGLAMRDGAAGCCRCCRCCSRVSYDHGWDATALVVCPGRGADTGRAVRRHHGQDYLPEYVLRNLISARLK